MIFASKIPRTVTHHTRIVLKVEIDTVCSPPWLALSDHDRRHDFFPQFWLALLDCGHHHVTSTGGWQAVQSRTKAFDRDDVEVTGSGVVAAIHDGTAGSILVQLNKYRPDLEEQTYTGRPRVILSLLPEAEPRLQGFISWSSYRNNM